MEHVRGWKKKIIMKNIKESEQYLIVFTRSIFFMD